MMTRVLCLLSIYILLDNCNNAWTQTLDFTSVEVDEISFKDRAHEGNDEDYEHATVEVDGISVEDRAHDGNYEHEKLLGLDYYSGALGIHENKYVDSVEDLKGTIKNGNNIVVLDTMDTRNYNAEMQAGNKGELLGTNPHYYQPKLYPDFSRRFVLQYPYTEVGSKNTDEVNTNELVPTLASPDLVLAVAQESALLDAAAPKNPSEKLVTKDILRSGDYWNAIWKEDVNPYVLRSKHPKKLETVRAEIPPGSKLYDLVSKLKHLSPTLLYIINENNP